MKNIHQEKYVPGSPEKNEIIHKPKSNTPLLDGYKSIRYTKNAKGAIGFTPNGKNTIPLESSQGRNHANIQSPGLSSYHEDTFLNHDDYFGQRGALLAEMTSLFYRINGDKDCISKDINHYETTFYKIQLCKHLLQRMLTNFPEAANEIINFFNKSDRAYDLDKAQEIYEFPNPEHYDKGAYDKLITEGLRFSIQIIKNYKPQLNTSWLIPYRDFNVRIVIPEESIDFRKRNKQKRLFCNETGNTPSLSLFTTNKKIKAIETSDKQEESQQSSTSNP